MSMLTVIKPSDSSIRQFLAAETPLGFTYKGVGSTATTPPAGYNVDRTRVELGSGKSVFRAAKEAMKRWKHFEVGWVESLPSDTPLEAGAVVGVLVRLMGLWWLNSARIVYVIDDENTASGRFGFAYGTLPGHAESGEERFLIEWNRADDLVTYELLAFSWPRHILARLGYPLVRRLQKRFARDSCQAMVRAVRI